MIKDCDYSQKHGKFMCFIHDIIIFSIKILAILAAVVIILGTISSLFIIYKQLIIDGFILSTTSFFLIFSEIMLVLIAVEIFQNIAMYIRTDVVPMKMVLATALIAVARKFIVIDVSKDTPWHIAALAGSILSISLSYWLISRHHNKN